MNPKVLVGAFIGAMAAFAFSSYAMEAVGKAAQAVVMEVRRQFKEIKGLLKGKAKADYASCVMIVTKSAQTQMIAPSLMAIFVPVISEVSLKRRQGIFNLKWRLSDCEKPW